MKQSFNILKGVWKLLFLFLLILITFSYAMFQGGFVSWFLFYSFLPFGIYAIFLFFYPLNQMEAERSFQKNEFNAGESLKVTIILKRKSAFPLLYLVVEECSSEELVFSMQRIKAKRLLFPGFRKEITWDYQIDDLPRGEHFLRAIRMKTGDSLGLIEKEKQIHLEDKFIVYPVYEELIYRPMENHFDKGMAASKERVQRDTSVAIGIREYQPGDRFSWINWKATAKRNEMMTKEFEQRKSHDVYIMMDCTPDSRFEAVVSFTASIIRAILLKGAQVGFLSVASERVAFPVRSGESQQQQLFYHLAKVRDNSLVPIDRVLEAENFLVQQNVNLMLITAQITKALIDKVGFFATRKGTVTIFLLKNEQELPSPDDLALKAEAKARGLRVVFVHDGNFASVFSEVASR
ncbi:DUF58 domain-containing protein [Bacillus sp. FJAT-29790]|uniref:DUF58 domain-containing protein n=1 Tax=Bacillus sp. FJAT-29790 TaxID=1895002 RepID=UPI001C22E18C|nr:DUF58 domain-containing protein [Bacillus sp. FJAT-29790]MBU8881378.1 DUF58 domain-containing protein [Bacillus sp. FJAT-29790]